MRTKSLFDYDHEGTKNNKNDIFNYTQVYLKKVQFRQSRKNYCAFQIWIKIFCVYPNAVFKHALQSGSRHSLSATLKNLTLLV